MNCCAWEDVEEGVYRLNPCPTHSAMLASGQDFEIDGIHVVAPVANGWLHSLENDD